MKKTIATPNAPQAIGPYSQAIRYGDFLFVSGQVAIDPSTGDIVEGDIEVQTDRVLKNITAIVEAAGMSLQNVVKCTCFLKDMNDFQIMNEEFAKVFPVYPPARTTVQTPLAEPEMLVEIEAVAYIGS